MKKLFSCGSLFLMLVTGLSAQTTRILFPVNSLFGGAIYNKPMTITAANTLVSDGVNLWAGTFINVPASTTNPIVSLYPNTYLLTVAGVVKAARFTVPTSTNVVDVTPLITSGPLFYFSGSGLANLLAGTNIVFVTNVDGSITINGSASAGGPMATLNTSNLVFGLGADYITSYSFPPGGADQMGLEFWMTNNGGGYNMTLRIDDDSVNINGDLNLGNYSIYALGGVTGYNFHEVGNQFQTDGAGNVTAISYTGQYISTNGTGASQAIAVQTNSVGPHGLWLQFTNGLFIGTSRY